MPTYEYRCLECGRHVEVVQSFTDDPLTECGACGGTLRKVFSPVGIVLKGSGFYRTDSRGSGTRSTSRTEKESSPKESSSGGEKSTEAKSA
jgi:putative FmdB family regulatory protein